MKAKSPRVTTAPTRSIRLAPLSVSEQERELIQRAATVVGWTVAQFCRDATLKAAKQVISKEQKE